MQVFSGNIEKLSSSRKEQYLKNTAPLVGLPEDRLTTLFESFEKTNVGLTFDEVIVKFENMLTPKQYSFAEFKNTILEITNNQDFSVEKRYEITNKLLDVINNCAESADINTLLDVICFILERKSENFTKISNQLEFLRNGLEDLFESTEIDFSKINVLAYKPEADNHINTVEDKRFYESLKHILARNNQRWGSNYHLENAYKTIVNFLDKETEKLVNDQNMVVADDNFHMQLIKEMLTKDQMNPMYRSIDVLKTLVPDMQTLVFDCMLLVHSYIGQQNTLMEFISRSTYLDYIEAAKILYSNISSSHTRSKIAYIDQTWSNRNKKDDNNDNENVDYRYYPMGTGFSEVFENFRIDSGKIDIFTFPVRMNTAVDCVHIIKAAETEVTLPLRKILNLYVTKTMNLLRSTNNKIIETHKTNKYKTSY